MSLFRCAMSAARPALVARSALKASASSSLRAFSTTLRASSDAKPPSLFGPGGKAGEVPTDFEQATGLERFEMLGEMEGVDVFDETPLESGRVGTKADPIMVHSNSAERIIGCTGCPADSHDIMWLVLDKSKQRRCPECGSVYQMDFQGEEEEAHHH